MGTLAHYSLFRSLSSKEEELLSSTIMTSMYFFRISEAKSPDLVSVSQYYSGVLVTYLRKVASIQHFKVTLLTSYIFQLFSLSSQ